MPPSPWQQHVLDVALEVEPFEVRRRGVTIRTEYRLCYREVRLFVPRQSGKTLLLFGLMLHRCLANVDQRVVYTAQTRNHAREKFVDEHIEILEQTRFRRFCRKRLTNGSEKLYFPKKGQRSSWWGIDSTTEKAGHGPTLDLIVCDEYFAQHDDRVESGVRPTMITRPQPQMWFVSTFGDDKEGASMSAPLWTKVDDSRRRCREYEAGNLSAHGSVASFEWSAADIDADDIDYGDVELWRRTMPALQCNGGIITEEAVRADFESMSLASFKRAYLNLRPRRNEVVRVIPADVWSDAGDRESSLYGLPLAFGFHVAQDNESAAIGFGGRRADGKMHVAVLDVQDGTAWVIPRLVKAAAGAGARFVAIGYDPSSPSAALILPMTAAFKKAGISLVSGKESKLIKIAGHVYAAACSAFYTGVIEHELVHRDQEWLNTAVEGCKKRPIGDAWVWDRKHSMVSIAALDSVTLAARAFEMAPPPVTKSKAMRTR